MMLVKLWKYSCRDLTVNDKIKKVDTTKNAQSKFCKKSNVGNDYITSVITKAIALNKILKVMRNELSQCKKEICK